MLFLLVYWMPCRCWYSQTMGSPKVAPLTEPDCSNLSTGLTIKLAAFSFQRQIDAVFNLLYKRKRPWIPDKGNTLLLLSIISILLLFFQLNSFWSTSSPHSLCPKEKKFVLEERIPNLENNFQLLSTSDALKFSSFNGICMQQRTNYHSIPWYLVEMEYFIQDSTSSWVTELYFSPVSIKNRFLCN